MKKFETIDEYIAAQERKIQPILNEVRDAIVEADEELNERMSWQMPTFWHKENVIHFCAFKDHYSIFPGGDAVEVFSERLKGFRASKGTIQFPYDKPVERELIGDIVRWRMQLIRGGTVREQTPARKRETMPEELKRILNKEGLMQAYESRPPYQQNDYIRWIVSAKREQTRQKRQQQMLQELREGTLYMGRVYRKTK